MYTAHVSSASGDEKTAPIYLQSHFFFYFIVYVINSFIQRPNMVCKQQQQIAQLLKF